MAGASVESPAFATSLRALRDQLVARGMTDEEAAAALATVQEVGDDPAFASRMRQMLAQPVALAQAILRDAPQSVSGWALAGLLALAGLAGPLLAYPVFESSSQAALAIGDPFQAYSEKLPGWVGLAAGILGVVLLATFLLRVSRYRRPTLLGFFGGLAGGGVEILAAVLPWASIVGSKTTCVAGSGCTVQAGVPEQIGLFAAVCFAIPFVLALTGISGLLGLWLQRRRLLAAVRSA
jgi:hypothetical protein